MLSLKNSLKVLRKTNALWEGHFILSSGLHSSQYVQCAKLLSYPKLSDKFIKSLASKIKKRVKKPNIFHEAYNYLVNKNKFTFPFFHSESI